MEYTEPVAFKIDDMSFEWTPDMGLLADKDNFAANAQEQVIRSLVGVLIDEYGENFPATPEGPYLPTTLRDLNTTMYLLHTMYPDSKIKIEGERPSLPSLGLGRGSSTLEDGSEVIN